MAYDSSGDPWFRVGDIVTRDGSDRQRVISTNGDDHYAPQLIVVECIKPRRLLDAPLLRRRKAPIRCSSSAHRSAPTQTQH
jgi:hypothetical protein